MRCCHLPRRVAVAVRRLLLPMTVALLVASPPSPAAAAPISRSHPAVHRHACRRHHRRCHHARRHRRHHHATRPLASPSPTAAFNATVHDILALPYQPAYVPAGPDTAFPATTLNTAPAQDYTSGSIPGSPDHPAWPPAFHPVTLTSTDGATLTGELATRPGNRPAVLVVHGFNTNGKESVIRWAAMLAADGYDVLAADQRDFAAEYDAGYEGPSHDPQTFGWKEGQDVLAAGRYLRSQAGVTSVGILGFSEGAQNTILALAQDAGHLFTAGLTFSAPADQDTQVYSTAAPPNCQTPVCTYPATEALATAVVPPYDQGDPCTILENAATQYGTTPRAILAGESAMHAQTAITVPLLNFYAADDPLVHAFQATMMAGLEQGHPLQRTVELEKGAHAYYYDRWWQQEAILAYFHALLPNTGATSTAATVNQTPGGAPAGTQTVSLAGATPQSANAQLGPYICDTSQPPPA